MLKRWYEFFEGGEQNRLSMGRLVMFLSLFPASFVIITKPDGETFGWYVSAYVLGFVGGKGADVVAQIKGVKDAVVTDSKDSGADTVDGADMGPRV
jgi:hypothetical protein